jgi:hypothetical protein
MYGPQPAAGTGNGPAGDGGDGGDGGELLTEPATVLRESLFALPGYQVVYAHASLARLPTGPLPLPYRA